MRAHTFLLVVLLLGCGGSETAAPPSSTVAEAPPSTIAPPSTPPVTAVPDGASPPADFTLALGGGAVMRQVPAPGEMHATVRLEPRPGVAGAFDLVERNESVEPTAAPVAPIELRRAAVPADRALALWTSIDTHRPALEGPCANMEIMDGATHSIEVHANGADSVFRCTNASTPEFDAVQEGFDTLVVELLPPPPADS
jgi:hypothetical protein